MKKLFPTSIKQLSVPKILVILASLIIGGASVQVNDPDPMRYTQEFTAFSLCDSKNSVPEDAVLFVGSSSIRYWNTAERFPALPVINRGYGGSHISEINHWIEAAVLKYAMDIIVFYAGDNDIAAGKNNDQILEDYDEFLQKVLKANPATHIIFIAIKPSLARWALWPQMKAANARTQAYSESHSTLHFIDIATPML